MSPSKVLIRTLFIYDGKDSDFCIALDEPEEGASMAATTLRRVVVHGNIVRLDSVEAMDSGYPS